jgi:hypothetical protein
LLETRPAGEDFAAFFYADAVADVVAEDHIEAREHDLQEKIGEAPEVRGCRGDEEWVVDVAEDYELVGGAGFVELDSIEGPLGELCGRRGRCEGRHAVSF